MHILSICRFFGFTAREPAPERTGFVRSRAALRHRGLDRRLFEFITRQINQHQRGILICKATQVDATLLASTGSQHDGDARGPGPRRRKPVHGY